VSREKTYVAAILQMPEAADSDFGSPSPPPSAGT
jgi:hypothetical protein